MKISKIAPLCKQRKKIELLDMPDGCQWLSDGQAMYPLYDLPRLDKDTIIPVLSITDKEAEKLKVEHTTFFGSIPANDSFPDEHELSARIITFVYGGTAYEVFCDNASSKAIFIQSKYLAPLRDGADEPELFLRRAGSHEIVAAKKGFLLTAMIVPDRLCNVEDFTRRISDLSYICQNTAEPVIKVDRETGEIIE